MRLIDVDDLGVGRCSKDALPAAYCAGWNGLLGLIEKAPTVDAEPVVHAEWVVCGDGDNVPWMCSHCGKTTAHKYKVIYGKYCPNCGAKMNEGDDNACL